MGSLMSGWDSQVLSNPNAVEIERNRSLTKEEIDSFWKVHGKIETELDVSNEPPPVKSPLSPLGPFFSKDSPKGHQGNRNGVDNNEAEASLEIPNPPEGKVENKKGDWWTKSNWAFLNEPPEEDDASQAEHKYCAQFHVAKLATSTTI